MAESNVNSWLNPARRGKTFRPQHVMIDGRKRAYQSHFACSIGMADDRPKPSTSSQPEASWRGGTDVRQRSKGRQVARINLGMIHQLEELGFDEKEVRNLFRFNGGKRIGGFIRVAEDNTASSQQRNIHEDLGKVRERPVYQLNAIVRARCADHRSIRSKISATAFWHAG